MVSWWSSLTPETILGHKFVHIILQIEPRCLWSILGLSVSGLRSDTVPSPRWRVGSLLSQHGDGHAPLPGRWAALARGQEERDGGRGDGGQQAEDLPHEGLRRGRGPCPPRMLARPGAAPAPPPALRRWPHACTRAAPLSADTLACGVGGKPCLRAWAAQLARPTRSALTARLSCSLPPGQGQEQVLVLHPPVQADQARERRGDGVQRGTLMPR